jgi:hypothetical protein
VKTIWTILGAVPLTAGLMLAQDSTAGGQSWHGLLVAVACQSTGSDMNRTTSDINKSSDMKRKTPDSATAGREQSTTYEQTANQADRSATTSTPMARNTANTDQSSSMNQTRDMKRDTPRKTGETTSMANSATADDSMKRNTAKNSAGDDMDKDRATVAGLDNSCRISSQTTAFALRLEDGRVVRFDDASNSKIATQLQSGDRLAHKTKVFRANVRGSMQGDTISADTVEM